MIKNLINRPDGFLVVRRLNWFTELPIENPIGRIPDRVPAVSSSHEEIRAKYRGFDGWAWPDVPNTEAISLESGLAPFEQYHIAQDYYDVASKEHLCDLIYLQFPEALRVLPPLPIKFRFLGYDYGYYLSESGAYSSLFHEVIYGLYNEMRSYAGRLNYHLLLPTIETAELLDCTRNQLLEVEADLESDEACIPIAIYGISTE